jgi:transcription-repair coupling factor (superfamily II helicase)
LQQVRLNLSEFVALYAQHPQIKHIAKWMRSASSALRISGLQTSAKALAVATLSNEKTPPLFVIENDADTAAYFYHDLTQLLGNETVYFFPSSYRNSLKIGTKDTSNEILRTETLAKISAGKAAIVVSYPEAIAEKIISGKTLKANALNLTVGELTDTNLITAYLQKQGFIQVDFVYEPGQFSIRGSIFDIFSYSFERPYRIDFFGDEIESIRTFDIEKQLSLENKKSITVLPNISEIKTDRKSFFEFIGKESIFIFNNVLFVKGKINQLYDNLLTKLNQSNTLPDLHAQLIVGDEFLNCLSAFRTIEIGTKQFFKSAQEIEFQTSAQPIFHKNFDLLSEQCKSYLQKGYRLYICSDSVKQTDRIAAIFKDRNENINFTPVVKTLHEGFIDHDLSICCFTDHQIFDRFHKFSLRSDQAKIGKMAQALKDLSQFRIGDYVVHIDHGVGKFGGLFKTEINGKQQEVIKLIYKDNDIIFVSIHGLHRISKYKSKEGAEPTINKLGTGAWERLKERTKTKVKDIARDLIKLYTQRKAQEGFRFSPDSYLQQELEASFLYEDTPDQSKATADIKHDMESARPMDRLVCGDVGFGKTEVAMRAAFKAATDGKQVAVLVPTTVLALQHYHTFTDRFKNFPIKIEYLSRAKKSDEVKKILAELKEGKIDVIIGTHKIVGKNVQFKDLGLLIIDEEQKFGVSIKEKLKQMKVNVDTLTLTATPIPRTLQFSLMGARDLSIINTPPPNRFPIITEVINFDEEIVKKAIIHEIERNGQVFVVNNRVQNLYVLQNTLKRLVPEARTAVAHGQMQPNELEETIMDFINYDYDILIATTIVESGVDIPNVNTIIINNAHMFGLSDLHQLRGRVGRSNRKAYCYLIAPPLSDITDDARRRLQAIETFAELGSGFNIAMQDLDIRGAGNILGSEQSGFIADLGYETYQKILNEAMIELREMEFKDLFDEKEKNDGQYNYVTDCQIESDLELLFPTWYIENVSERMALYRELDNISTPAELEAYKQRLIDRFGKIPPESEDLMKILPLRWNALKLGIERLVLKQGRMIAYLVSDIASPFYQSNTFGDIINYIANHPRNCQIKEVNHKRSVDFGHITSIDKALAILDAILKK